ncbi:E3 ubiquitin-protein ligase RNF135 [Balaenoptera ricei]|uniref:E3 ubiquitin-protein ligase RNF135 n=1 Tax=Balaenoptera ricei TaxID=2746895 RepID=UPI0028BEE30B|nr:E3 ubiquitin-protein ligase RNF135 [Balaenoptera ricei]
MSSAKDYFLSFPVLEIDTNLYYLVPTLTPGNMGGGGLGTRAGLDVCPAIPVWLAEDDLGCSICHELLARPATLPCGHSFSRDCLMGLWGAGRHGSCPTCREGAERPLQLRKNTMLQNLEDKYSREARELEGPNPAPGPRGRTAQLPALSDGVDLSLASPKLVTSNTPEGKMRDILRDLEEIQEKLQENFTRKETFEEQMQAGLPTSPGVFHCPETQREAVLQVPSLIGVKDGSS